MTAEETEEWIDGIWPRLQAVIDKLGYEEVLADYDKSDHPVSQAIADRIRRRKFN